MKKTPTRSSILVYHGPFSLYIVHITKDNAVPFAHALEWLAHAIADALSYSMHSQIRDGWG